ncbi:MAG: hypothetical protein RRZ64_00365 [Rikenellaceae bacterium]
MKGAHVKQKLLAEGLDVPEVAKRIGMTPEELNNILSSDNVPLDLLKRIEEAAGKAIFFIYENMAPTNSISGNNNTLGDNNNLDSPATMKLLDLLEKKDEQIDKLLAIIEKLKK